MYILGLCHKTHTLFTDHALTAMLEKLASVIILNLEGESNTFTLTHFKKEEMHSNHYHTDMN